MKNPEDSLEARARELINEDPAEFVELVTGRVYSDPAVSGLVLKFHLEHDQRKREVLSELHDTYFNMPWHEFLNVVLDSDFQLFIHDSLTLEEKYGSHVTLVAGDPVRKLLLIADAYDMHDGTSVVNTAKLYGTLDGGETREGQSATFKALCDLGSSFGAVGEAEFAFSADAREGMNVRLKALDAAGATYCDWVNTEHLSLSFASQETMNTIKQTLPDWAKAYTGL